MNILILKFSEKTTRFIIIIIMLNQTSWSVPVCKITLVKCPKTFGHSKTTKAGRIQAVNEQFVLEVVSKG